jgi:hypothetical protein
MKPFLTKFGHLIFQGVATVAQVGNAYLDFVPAKYKPLVGGVIGLAQGIVALSHHN